MKYIIYHARYGYIGMGDDPEYKDNDMKEAALFTEESAKRLLVDVKDPKMVVTEITEEQEKKLPFKLTDTQEILDKADNEREANDNMARTLTAKTLSLLETTIEHLPEMEDVPEDTNELILDMEGLEDNNTLLQT